MRLEIDRDCIRIYPENTLEKAYIEDTLKIFRGAECPVHLVAEYSAVDGDLFCIKSKAEERIAADELTELSQKYGEYDKVK